jgi:hypothetical protein
MIATLMLMQSNLPTISQEHAVMHVDSLLKYTPFAFDFNTPHHLAFGITFGISHLQAFGCQVMVLILGPKRK